MKKEELVDRIKKEDSSGFKKMVAERIIQHLDNSQKKEMLKKFREKNKDNPNLPELEENLKKMLGDVSGDKT